MQEKRTKAGPVFLSKAIAVFTRTIDENEKSQLLKSCIRNANRITEIGEQLDGCQNPEKQKMLEVFRIFLSTAETLNRYGMSLIIEPTGVTKDTNKRKLKELNPDELSAILLEEETEVVNEWKKSNTFIS